MNEFVIPNVKARDWIMSISKGVWNHEENKVASNSALNRWLKQGAFQINGEAASPDEVLDFPVWSLVLFARSKTKRVTLF